MSKTSHKHTSSIVQNHKAHLATAYNELGKELSSTKIKVVGNYTLGKVIGEGTYYPLSPPQAISYLYSIFRIAQGHMEKSAWAHTDSPPLVLLSSKYPRPFLLPSLEKYTIIGNSTTPTLLGYTK
jgi:hypothetical protein